jgi:hypothetical protein
MINTQGFKKRAGIPSNEVSPDRAVYELLISGGYYLTTD